MLSNLSATGMQEGRDGIRWVGQSVRQAPYWAVSRQYGEDEESFRFRAGQVYFEAQQQETAEWWRRIGMPVEMRGRRVLDLGCGHGALSLDAARRGATSVTGVDTDSDRIGFARRLLRERQPDLAATICLIDQPLETLPCVAAFDIILSKDTFEHVEDLGRLIAAAGCRLRAGGLLVCGFSPLYYSPNGDHDRLGLPLPWLHAVLPQALVYRWASRRTGRLIRSAADVGLNRLTLAEFESFLPLDAWEQVSLRVNPIDHPLRVTFDLLRKVPGLARYFTIGVYAVYRKRDRSAACDNNRTAGAAKQPGHGDFVAAPGPPDRDAFASSAT